MNLSIVIPQIFYDIIARILPGMTILAATYALTRPMPVPMASIVQWNSEATRLPWLAALSVMMLAYLLATLLETLWHLPDLISRTSTHRGKEGACSNNGTSSLFNRLLCFCLGIFRPPFNPKYKIVEATVIAEFDAIFPGKAPRELPEIPLMYDILRMRDPESGSRVVKLRSEVHAYRRLIVGWFICSFIALRYFFIPGGWRDGISIELTLILFWGLSVAIYIRREEQYYWSLANNFLLKFYVFP